jgi:hypothetical protein
MGVPPFKVGMMDCLPIPFPFQKRGILIDVHSQIPDFEPRYLKNYTTGKVIFRGQHPDFFVTPLVVFFMQRYGMTELR